jgi:trans-aconitate 2-methyltransferase
VNWVNEDLARWQPPASVDVIYSNAALHWLPQHRELFAKYMGYLVAGGILAVQMPRNFAASSHALIAETVYSGPWCDRLTHLLHPTPVGDMSFYYDVLAPLASEVDVWEMEYLHVLTGTDPVKEWTKGTWLKQFLDALHPEEREPFEWDYAARLRHAYPQRPDGTTLFPFKRLFVIAIARGAARSR